ncbi:putative DNA-directed RNA polymerase II 14.5 kDa polypeptide [Ceraceosorus guamensis]|uniref:DNA-directed RNA polymerase subunit n=1 Tax=Ceraceosorus guamensis TaxID=1522189 RepID=A0A316VVR9_9BASI|nr:putative DNA-directed RNA polymerase II 14.5 kDa polypeptide [Ceraceosorus guamensis]PWN41038.1 putative DNA-directed RNA polymerase II 14.5 kDa polypeptide [Ceraceosorus guamensis]
MASSKLAYCFDCSNLLYPKVDRTNHVLLYACRNCSYWVEAEETKVWSNDLMSVQKEQQGVVDGLPQDPTLPRTHEHPCPRCGHSEAVFFQDQGKRIHNRMILFYVCADCNHTFHA